MSYPSPKYVMGGTVELGSTSLSLGPLGITKSSSTSIMSLQESNYNRLYLNRSATSTSASLTLATGLSTKWAVGMQAPHTPNNEFVFSSSGFNNILLNTSGDIFALPSYKTSLTTEVIVPAYLTPDGLLRGTSNNVITDSTATRTFALTDCSKYIRFTYAGAITLTLPTNASVAIPVGTEIHIAKANAGAGNLTIAGTPTLNILGVAVNPITANDDKRTLKKIATDTWDLF